MQKVFEKIIKMLEESKFPHKFGCNVEMMVLYDKAIEIVKEVAADINVGHKNGWIPIEESLPDTDRLVLISFVNYGVPQIGRYREDEEGGAFYLGDEDVPMSKYGIMVNAWMELPRCYEDK